MNRSASRPTQHTHGAEVYVKELRAKPDTSDDQNECDLQFIYTNRRHSVTSGRATTAAGPKNGNTFLYRNARKAVDCVTVAGMSYTLRAVAWQTRLILMMRVLLQVSANHDKLIPSLCRKKNVPHEKTQATDRRAPPK